MIWFNLKKLEYSLSNGLLTERSAYQYLLTVLIFFLTATYLPAESSYNSTLWHFVHFFLILIVMIWGVNSTFTINRAGHDKEYLKRFLSLSFVISIWLIATLALMRLIYKIIMFVIPLSYYESINSIFIENISEILISTGITVIFYLFLIRSFKRVNDAAISS